MGDELGEYIHVSVYAAGKWHKITRRFDKDFDSTWDTLWQHTGEAVKHAIQRTDAGGEGKS